MAASEPRSTVSTTPLLAAGSVYLLAILAVTSMISTVLSTSRLALQLVSPVLWMAIIRGLGGSVAADSRQPVDAIANVPTLTLFSVVLIAGFVAWFFGAWLLARRNGSALLDELSRWGRWGGCWLMVWASWEWCWIASTLIGPEVSAVLEASVPFWWASALAGWATAWFSLWQVPPSQARPIENGPLHGGEPGRMVSLVWVPVAVYVAVFFAMNWALYCNLLIPHGDSAMYEEHLWNLVHGKGFRSYLDNGRLFLGEHIQFVHLLLMPIYLIFPSHLTMEFCESMALALGAFPVSWMVARKTNSQRAGFLAAIAYLMYVPLHFLDIEVDLKTFRPEAFGTPLLLMTLDQLDRRRLAGTLIGMLFCLTVKEDYSLILGPLGLWILGSTWRLPKGDTTRKAWFLFGASTVIASPVYLFLATRVLMPWFRSGAEIHYASYFSKYGKSPEEIVMTMLSQPTMLIGDLCTGTTLMYAVALLVAVGCIPLLAPDRLAVGLPLFGILCLNELARDPRHHFHAPLVAIVFWGLAGGMGFIRRRWDLPAAGGSPDLLRPTATSVVATWVVCSSCFVGLFWGMTPAGIAFWDAGSPWNWESLYWPSQRAKAFGPIEKLIPPTARVASTDFVHPRFTHCERSYDLSPLRPNVPEDTDYIVVDLGHRYSTAKSAEDIAAYRAHPDQWEILKTGSEKYFLVLKRKK